MRFRYVTYLSWLILVGSITAGRPALAQTRLGLHVTQEELNIWRQRMTDGVNRVNGYSFQSIYQNRILADANAFRSQSHPGGDGFWTGYTGTGCVPADDQSIRPGAGGTPFGRGNGAYLMRSAFNFLLTGDASYANPVRTELLNQITVAGTNWANTATWCFNNLGGGNVLEIVPWIFRLVIAFDYLNAGGYTGFSATELTNIRNWFRDAANLWMKVGIYGQQTYTAYPNIFKTPQDLTCIGDCTSIYGALYFGGPQMRKATNFFTNQSTPHAALAMAVGLMLNDTALINYSAALFTAYIKVGTFDNGAISDFNRWADCTGGCPGSMWGHTESAVGALIAIADMYARSGNRSLYDLMAPTKVLGGSGTTVGLRTILKLLADMANRTVQYYGTTNPSDLTSARLLTWDSDIDQYSPRKGNYYDFSSMVANLYYNDATIQTAMTRNLLAENNNVSGCNDSQMAGCFSAIWANLPDVPFMFGNMGGKVNPYGGSAGGGTLPNPPLNLKVQ